MSSTTSTNGLRLTARTSKGDTQRIGCRPSRFLACSLRVGLAEKNTVKFSTEHKCYVRIEGEIGACTKGGAWLEADIYFWNTQILLITGCTCCWGFMFWGFALLPVKAVRPVPLVAPVHRDPNFLRDFEGFPTSNPTAPTDQD
ncbi:hypothetical protein FRC0024_02093 [Corynebacterium diphtheriae]|nr:hypothetical protein FRC0024_02093 [Corynebacterium diphtheriae]